jgi:hypothetical protein
VIDLSLVSGQRRKLRAMKCGLGAAAEVGRSVVAVGVTADPARSRASVSFRTSWASLQAAAARSRLPPWIFTMFRRRSFVFFTIAVLASSRMFLFSRSEFILGGNELVSLFVFEVSDLVQVGRC